jgi:hypothetical protein
MTLSIVRRPWFIPLCIAVIVLAFFAHTLLTPFGEALPGDDFIQQFYPWFHFVVESVHETGTLPLWNPHQFLGNSVAANPQIGLFYPPNWLMIPFGADHIYTALAFVIALHAVWAGWGMYVLMRLWGADRSGAFVAALLLATGGFVTARVRAGHYSMVTVYAWLPWVLAGYRLALQRRRWYWALPAGMALGMGILGGYPQLIYFLGMVLVLHAVYELVRSPVRPTFMLVARQLIILGVVGLLLSSVSWMVTLDYLPKASRENQQSLIFANEQSMPANRLALLAIPNLFGARLETDTPPGYWGEAPYFEESLAYTGLLPLLGLLLVPFLRKRRLWLFAAVAVLGILLSLGFDGVLWLALYRWVPVLRNFRGAARALALTNLGLAALMALLVTALARAPLSQRQDLLRPLVRRGIPALLAVLWIGALALTVANSLLEDGTNPALRAATMVRQLGLAGVYLALAEFALWLWTDERPQAARWAAVVTVVVAILDVWHIAWPLTYTTEVQFSPPWANAAVDIPTGEAAAYGRVMQMSPPPGIPNGATWTGHQTPQGYDPSAPAGWATLNLDATWNPASPINRLFGVKYVISGTELKNYGFGGTEDWELIGIRDGLVFYENPDPLPRAFVASAYEVVPDETAARQRIGSGDMSTGETVVLAMEPGCTVDGSGGTATITHYEPNSVTVDVEADGAGLLVLSDQYDDDWKVTVDGEDATLLEADIALRAVCVPDGAHTVRFDYRPWTVTVGGIVTLAGWALMIPVSVVLFWRRARDARPDEDRDEEPDEAA